MEGVFGNGREASVCRSATGRRVDGGTVQGVRHLPQKPGTRSSSATENAEFKDFEALKERHSSARVKDTTLDYAQRRGFEVAAEPMRKATEREPVQGKQAAFGPIQRFKVAQLEFIKAAGRFGLDSDASLSVAEARQQMSSAAQQISKDAGLMQQAERAGIVQQVKSLTHENRRGLSKEKGFELER